MSAMAEMVADMMMKALPDEVRLLLSPENLQKLQQNVILRWQFVEGSLKIINAAQNVTLEGVQANTTELAEMRAILERIEANVGASGSRKPAPKRQLRIASGGAGTLTGTDG